MIRKKPHLLALVGAGAVAALIASCAPGQTVDETPSAGPTEVEQVDPADFAGETLNYIYFTDGPDEAGTRELIEQFETEYDVTVNLEIMPYSDLVTSVTQRLTAGNAPDVARLTNLVDFRNDLMPLDPYIGAEFSQEFLEGPRSAGLNDDGQLIAVPSDLTINAPFINVDMFNEAGVDLPDPENPWTWDELIEAATTVQEATGSSHAIAIDKSGHRLSTVLSQYGTALVDGDGLTLDPAAAKQALEPIIEMMETDAMPRDFWIGTGTRYEGANEIFIAGETPIYMSGNWNVGYLADNAEFEWAAAPNPCAVECGGFPGGKFMGVFSQSKKPALAAEFVRFMNTTESQRTFVQAAGALPTRIDLAETGVEYPADHQAAMDVFMSESILTPIFGYAANGSPAFSASATELVNQISEVVVGNKDLDTAIADLSATIEDVVEELGSW